MRSLFALIISLVALCACRQQHSQDLRGGWTCIAIIPGVEGPVDAAVGKALRQYNIRAFMEGSLSYSVFVRTNDAETARAILRTNSDLIVVREHNGILVIDSRQRLPSGPQRSAPRNSSFRPTGTAALSAPRPYQKIG